jgi:hypothetical protein
MLRELPRNVKVAGILILVAIVALIGYGIYKQVMKTDNVAITVAVAPSDASISIDGKTSGTGTVYLASGKAYKVVISKDGFSTYSVNQYIDSAHDTISVALSPISDEAKKWVEENQDQYLAIEGDAGAQANATGEEFSKQNPITDDLPIDNLIYTIGYKNDQTDPSGNSIIITVDAAAGYRNGAIQAIRDLGYDPTKYKIEFKDYQNPFAS